VLIKNQSVTANATGNLFRTRVQLYLNQKLSRG